MNMRLTLIGCALALTTGSARTSAQLDTSRTWRDRRRADLWALFHFHGRVGVGPVATNADISFHDLLKALRFAFMANAEVRKGRWFGDIDVLYASLGKENVIAFRGGTRHARAHAKNVDHPTGRRLHDRQSKVVRRFPWWIPRLGSENHNRRGRHEAAQQPALDRARLADATAGFRFHWLPYQKLRVLAGGDGGGGGSHGTWQAYGLVGYDAWSRVALGAGYRYLFVNYEDSNYLLDADLRGFGLGASVHW